MKHHFYVFCYLIGLLATDRNKCNCIEYPYPPETPTAFENQIDLQNYLHKLHKYYVVAGRPR